MADWETRLTAADVEPALRNLLEDWEDGVANAIDDITASEVARLSTPAGSDMARALGLLNAGKSAVSTFIPGRAAEFMASPGIAIPLSIFGELTSLMQKASATSDRVKVLHMNYANVRNDLMKLIRKAEHTFPTTAAGRDIAAKIERICQGLSFKDSAARNSWLLRFLEHLGAIELDERELKIQMKQGFHPLFEKLGWLIGEGLKDTRSGFGRIIGTDPKFKWSGFDIHVPGSHKKSRGATWPGSEPKAGFRRAESDEIVEIVRDVWKYSVTRRSLLVGSHGVTRINFIVEVSPNPQGVQHQPSVKSSIDAMFAPANVKSALVKAREDVGPNHVSMYGTPFLPGQEDPHVFQGYAASLALN